MWIATLYPEKCQVSQKGKSTEKKDKGQGGAPIPLDILLEMVNLACAGGSNSCDPSHCSSEPQQGAEGGGKQTTASIIRSLCKPPPDNIGDHEQ